jgi:WD40 repeat protein
MKNFFTVRCSCIATLLCLSANNLILAQHQADTWFFGSHSAIQFTGMPAPIINGAINTAKGCASISDSLGNVMFYTDGSKVWNANNNVMQNGTGLLGGASTQAALITPKPGSNTEYYIFTNDVNNGQNGLQYSIVDMTLDSGKGAVTAQNFLVQDQITEKMAITSTHSGDAYWLTVHEYGTNMFYNYKVLNTGLDPLIIVSNTGISHNSSSPQNGEGQMKYSPCGDKLAVAIGTLDTVEVFDFDDSTGIISNPIDIPFPNPVYGIEFSENGRVLYVTTTGQNTLYQLDLSSGNTTDILNSRKVVTTGNEQIAIQLTPLKNIYISRYQTSWMGVINNPDSLGSACDFVDSILSIAPGTAGMYLPGFPAHFFRDSAACNSLQTGISESKMEFLTVYPNPSLTEFNLQINQLSLIEIYDIHGKRVDEFEVTSSISFGNNYEAGMYIVHVRNNDGIQVAKIVKH